MLKKNLISSIKYLILTSIIVGAFLFVSPNVYAQSLDVNQAFGGDTGQNAETLAANAGLGTTDFRLVIARIINIALGFLGIIAVSLIIYAGWLWMSAAGNEKQIETAKKIMQAAAIGLVIILAAFGIAAFVMRVLLGATGGGGTSEVCMTVGETRTCGCGGAQTCSSEKTWGACIGSNCSGLPETFEVSKIKPPENIPDAAKMPKNTRINIYFNLPVDENSVSVSTIGSGKIEVKKDGTILTDANIGYEISGSQITLTSKGTCAANSCGAAGCFEPGIYSVEVKAGSVQTSAGITNKGVQGYTTTPGSFTIIDSVDCQDPKINLISNNTQICLNSDNNISANASDDSGVTDVTYSDSNDGSAFTGNKVKENSPYDIIWRPTETKGYKAMSAYTISGKATDVVGRTADNSITKTLRAEHCCNGLQDGDEKGLDCGGADCAACAAAVCGNDVKQCAANNDACASGVCKLASDGKDCRCQDVPIIDYLNPEDGAPGNLTVIGGRFFGATAGKIYFCKTVKPSGSCDEYIEAKLANAVNSQCTGAWQTNKIFAIVPANAISGPVKVEAANGFTDESNDGRGSFNKIFTINNIKRPGLCKVEPAEAEFDKTVTLHGIQLGATAARENILFGNAAASVPSVKVGTWTDKKIDGVGVPNMTAGKTTISILQNKIRSNFLEFKILPNSKTPFITKIEPVAGHAGDYVTIYGGNFGKGDNKSFDKVLFGTIEADMTFPAECTKENLWQADKILVKVPADVNGNLDIKVQVSDGAKSSLTATSPNKFLAGDYCRSTYAACGSPECGDCVKSAVPGICKLDPDNGPVGASVNIYGERLGNSGTARFSKGSKKAIQNWSLVEDKNKIKTATTIVPSGVATKGRAEVVLLNGTLESNSLPFDIGSCVNVAGACASAEVCCPAASNFAGSCLAGTEADKDKICGLVPAKTYSQYYIEFSTAEDKVVSCDENLAAPACQIIKNDICANPILNPDTTKSWCNPVTCNCETPKPPKVVEECDRKEGQCVTQNLPSPSPWTPNWDDSVTPVKKPKACVNAIITARFDQKMDEASIALNNILVKSCNGENTGCDTKVNPVSGGLTVGVANTDQTYFSFYPAAEFSPNTWYQVTLKGGAGGIKAAGVNGLSLEKDYVWNFQTRESSVECSIGCVAVAPSKLTVHDKKSINYQAIPDSEDNACIMINPAPYTWQWSSDKPVKADAAIIEPTKSYLARVTPKEETATNDPVHITAAEQIHKKKGLGELTISFTNFYVVKKWPDCATACRNAEVGILFSDAVDFDSVVTGSGENIELYKCEPADCSTKTKKEIKSGSLQVSKVIPAEINFAPAKILDANAKYRVIVKGGANGVKSSLGKWLSDDKGAAQTEYAWDFNTQGVECAVDTVEMRPDKTYAYLVNEKNNHEALPKSKADECSASGQRLIGTGYAWRWSTPEDLTPEVKIAGISNNDFTPADGKIDPAQVSTAIGKGTVEKKKLAILTAEREVQATTISAEESSYFKHGQSDYYLICGFHNDNECRDAAGTDKSATYGVGKNSCCYPRPYVESSTPAHTDDPAPEVCRNALMSVTFNEPMDIASFNGNVLVAAKYENAACPENWQYLLLAGADNAPQKVAWLNRAVDWTIKELAKLPLIGKIFNASTALATDYGSNWCVVPGTVGGYNFDSKGYATFAPKELLKAGSEHLVLIKGDKDLTDGAHEGAKNIYGVSTGLPSSGASGVICRGDTTGKDCKINGKPFFGQIIKFTALEDKGAENNYGICAADKVKLKPASHLFTTNKNKTGDDTIAQAEVEDFADNDKIFIADALANNEQKIVSISGIYSWEWGWSTDNDAVAKVGERSKDTISSPNKAIIYTDATKRGSTYARGVINIKDDKYSLSANKTIGGAARIWVLLCNNPWPAYKENWTPFQDSNKNCQAGTGNCLNTNFEFYYCRDQGSTLLNDDLPAIADNGAILRSSEKTGALKEFLFTRPGKPEAPKLKVYTGILPGINCNTGDCNGDGVKDVFDKHFEFVSNKGVPTPNNGKVILIWDDRRSIIGVDTKIHRVYQREQGGAWQEIKDLSITEANCGAEGDRRGCYLLIDNLQNGTAYSFAVSTYNEYGESDFSNIINVTPKRTIAPSSAPTNLTAIISGNSVKLQWTKNTDSDVTNYKVYRGIDEDKNHEVRDAGNVNTYTWQNLDLKRTYYFKVTAAVDKLESATSNVIKIEKGVIK